MTDIATMPETTTPAVEAVDPEYPRFPPHALAHLRPSIRSRWAACIAKFDEDVCYRSLDRVFGIAEPCVVRTPASIGPAYAASCIGVRISCYPRDDGLRTGRVELEHADGTSELLAPQVGFVEDAVAIARGIVAVVAVTSDWMHRDLLALEDLGQLGLAQICMLHRAQAVRHVTPWGLSVWTVESTRARLCQFTSLSHVPGQHVIRQMALDESLSAQDLLPTARRWMPPVRARNGADSPVVTNINEGAVDTPKVAPGAINNPQTVTDFTTYSGLQATTETDLGSISMPYTVSSAAGPVEVNFNLVAATVRNSGVGSTQRAVQVVISLKRGSSYIMAGRVEGNFVPGLGMTVPVVFMVTDAPGAGTYTYKARYETHDDVNSTKQLFDAGAMYMQVKEVKR